MRFAVGASEAKGVNELIQAQAATTKTWDSDWMHNYPQQFKRTEFVALIRLEMKKRADRAAAAAAKEQAEVVVVGGGGVTGVIGPSWLTILGDHFG